MSLLIVLVGIALLIFLIIKKVNPMLALLSVSIITGLLLGMPVPQLISSLNNGIGSTLGGIVMVLALGAMLGKLAEESGAAQKIVQLLVKWFGRKNIQWAILLTGILAGIPLFYNAGFVVLIPLVFAIASTTKLPLLYVGMPMAAALSVTHGFLPPHPGPVALSGIFHASIGKTLMYGLVISIPVAIISGIIYPRLIRRFYAHWNNRQGFESKEKERLPNGWKSFLIVLLPVLLIGMGTAGALFTTGNAHLVFVLLEEPTVALLLSLAITLLLLWQPLPRMMQYCVQGVESVAVILLIIAAGGAFKQVLVDSKVGEIIKTSSENLHLSPLFLGWLIAALFRVTLGSATVAAITTSGMVVGFIASGTSPELMVLAVGSGSLMCSHVNDTGFWMFKEYFGLNLRQTFLTWTVMESLISLLGLAGVLLLNFFV